MEGWRTEEFTERWKKIEKSLAVELLKKHGESLEPFAELTMDLVDSYENSLLGLGKNFKTSNMYIYLSIHI